MEKYKIFGFQRLKPNRGVTRYLKLGGQGVIRRAVRRRCPAASLILSETGWAIAHPAHPPLTPRLANDHIISKPRLGSGVAQKRAVLKGRPLRDRYALTTTYRRPRVVNTALPKVSGTHRYKVIHERFYLLVISSFT